MSVSPPLPHSQPRGTSSVQFFPMWQVQVRDCDPSVGLWSRNGLVIQDWSCNLGLCLWFMCEPVVQVWDCASSQSVWSMPLTHSYPGYSNNGIWQSRVNQKCDKACQHCWWTVILSLLGSLSRRPRSHSVLQNGLLERNPLPRNTGLLSKDLSTSRWQHWIPVPGVCETESTPWMFLFHEPIKIFHFA